jgi:hypothetical protein
VGPTWVGRSGEDESSVDVSVGEMREFFKDTTITIDKAKAYRLAFRIVMAQGVRLSPYEAKTLVEDVFGESWEDIKTYCMENPH